MRSIPSAAHSSGKPMISQKPPKAPSQRAPSPQDYQASMNANGQGINTGAVLQGYKHDAQVKPNTGTATGDQAVQDFAKGQMMQGQANVARGAATQNAQLQGQLQSQNEQLTQQGRAQRMQRYQQAVSQQVSQMGMANEVARQRMEMQNQWRAGLIGLLS